MSEPIDLLLDAIAKSCDQFKDDLPACIEDACNRIRSLGDAELDALCFRRGVGDYVYQHRCQDNRRIWSSLKLHPGDPKVIAGKSETVDRVGRAFAGYDLNVAGRHLGDVLGSELEAIAGVEEETASGYTRRATLLRRLRPLVPDTKTVRQAVKLTKLKQLFVELHINGRDRLAG